MPCSNAAAKTRNQLKFAGVPQTGQPISAANRPKFTILWGQVEDILLFNKFFPIVDTCLSCEDIARQSGVMVPDGDFWRLFASCVCPSPHSHTTALHRPRCNFGEWWGVLQLCTIERICNRCTGFVAVTAHTLYTLQMRTP